MKNTENTKLIKLIDNCFDKYKLSSILYAEYLDKFWINDLDQWLIEEARKLDNEIDPVNILFFIFGADFWLELCVKAGLTYEKIEDKKDMYYIKKWSYYIYKDWTKIGVVQNIVTDWIINL